MLFGTDASLKQVYFELKQDQQGGLKRYGKSQCPLNRKDLEFFKTFNPRGLLTQGVRFGTFR